MKYCGGQNRERESFDGRQREPRQRKEADILVKGEGPHLNVVSQGGLVELGDIAGENEGEDDDDEIDDDSEEEDRSIGTELQSKASKSKGDSRISRSNDSLSQNGRSSQAGTEIGSIALTGGTSLSALQSVQDRHLFANGLDHREVSNAVSQGPSNYGQTVPSLMAK